MINSRALGPYTSGYGPKARNFFTLVVSRIEALHLLATKRDNK